MPKAGALASTGRKAGVVIRVQREDFDVGTELGALTRGKTGIGGVASFIGLMRDVAEGTPIHAMTLEHYPGMTERELQRIEHEAQQRWPLLASLIIHRYGRLEPGDRIVLVATAAAHRAAAFQSCEFLMDYLKTEAPFWKREETPHGPRWVAAAADDDEAASRWRKD
jgi:molybdopterin synthase catalytic subunit